MNSALLKALIAFVVVCFLFYWSKQKFLKKKNLSSKFLITGSVFLIIVSVVHIFEATQLFSFMGWGNPHSVGHYLDLTSAIFGIALFSLGLILNFAR